MSTEEMILGWRNGVSIGGEAHAGAEPPSNPAGELDEMVSSEEGDAIDATLMVTQKGVCC